MRSEYSANYHLGQPVRQGKRIAHRADGGITVFALLAVLALVPALAAAIHWFGGVAVCVMLALVGLWLLARVSNPLR